MTSTPQLIAAQDIFVGEEKHVVRLTYLATTFGTPVLDLEENTEYIWGILHEMRVRPDCDQYLHDVLVRDIPT